MMKKRSIQDIVNNFEKLPPDHCWESIESQLNLLSVQGADSSPLSESQTTSLSSSSSSKVGSLISKVVAAPLKVAAITGSVAIISVVSYFLIHQNDTTQQSPSIENVSKIDNSSLPLIDTVMQEDSEPVVVEESVHTKKQKEKDIEPSITVSQEVVDIHNGSQDPPFKTSVISPSAASYDNLNTTTKPQTTTPVITPTSPTPSISISASEDPIVPDLEVTYSTPVKLTIPNIFTPNGDGYNDYFVIEGIEQCEKSQLVIKSMNGRIVYRSTNYQNNWDGEGLPDGVYLYYFLYTINDIEKGINGKVVLKR